MAKRPRPAQVVEDPREGRPGSPRILYFRHQETASKRKGNLRHGPSSQGRVPDVGLHGSATVQGGQ